MKNLTIFSVFAFCLTSLMITSFSSNSHAQTISSSQINQPDQDDEPTVVTRGNITQKQREYSKRYSKYLDPKYTLSAGIKLAEKRNYAGEIVRSIIPEPNSRFTNLPLPELFRHLNCSSDAIVLGTPTSKAAKLTADESWIYTEYDFLIKEVFKNHPNSRLRSGNTAQITRPGGSVKLDGYVFRLRDEGFQRLRKNSEYLLFLHYVPEAEGYVAASAFGDFLLDGGRFESISAVRLPETLKTENNLQVILDNVRHAVTTDCRPTLAGEN